MILTCTWHGKQDQKTPTVAVCMQAERTIPFAGPRYTLDALCAAPGSRDGSDNAPGQHHAQSHADEKLQLPAHLLTSLHEQKSDVGKQVLAGKNTSSPGVLPCRA